MCGITCVRGDRAANGQSRVLADTIILYREARTRYDPPRDYNIYMRSAFATECTWSSAVVACGSRPAYRVTDDYYYYYYYYHIIIC